MPMDWRSLGSQDRSTALAVTRRIPGDRGRPESPPSVRNDGFDPPRKTQNHPFRAMHNLRLQSTVSVAVANVMTPTRPYAHPRARPVNHCRGAAWRGGGAAG